MNDEFFRPIKTNGPFDVTFLAKDRELDFVIPEKDSILVLHQMPYQYYLVNIKKDGFLEGSGTNPFYQYQKIIQIPVYLYPTPSSKTRIDSFQVQVNTDIPQVRFRIFTAQSVPSDGRRFIVLFAGLTPKVSSTFGTYVFSQDGLMLNTGSSDLITSDLFREMHVAGIPVGSRVYITARIRTGATKTSLDGKTGLTQYSNLEQNTTAVASFIMP